MFMCGKPLSLGYWVYNEDQRAFRFFQPGFKAVWY